MGDVGTTKVFEDDCIVVWEFVLDPGERTPLHTHENDYVFYVLEGSTIETFDADDELLFSFETRPGDVFSLRCEDGELIAGEGDGPRVPATHSARNAGAGRYREILVEKKKYPIRR